jgi:hypothetical protein
MAILLDWETYPNGQATVNKGHVKNPQGTKFLNAVMVSGPTALNPNAVSPGIGSDGVYRDPWSNPYIISFDLNYDDKCRDDFYSGKVSIDPSPGANPNGGLNGLVKSADGLYYEANSPVMVWSAGPDQMIDPSPSSAKTGVNKDNVLSWKQ